MHTRRAGHAVTRPLNFGVRRQRRASSEVVDTLEFIALSALLAALTLGFFLGRYRTHVFQNRGEARLSRALRRHLVGPDYHLLNHVTLRVREGTTQIDHVLVSRFGVFVIETKDYRGWIFASAGDRYWTQVLYRAKFRFQNPIRQNYSHA